MQLGVYEEVELVLRKNYPRVGAASVTFTILLLSPAHANGLYVGGSLDAIFREPFDTRTARIFSRLVVAPAASTPPPGVVTAGGPPIVPVIIVDRELAHTNYEPGGESDFQLGYEHSLKDRGSIRAELEVGFREYQIKNTRTASVSGQSSGLRYMSDLSTTAGLWELRYAQTINIFYDLPPVRGVSPYVGVGAGYQEGIGLGGERSGTYSITGAGFQSSGTVTTRLFAHSNADSGAWLAEAGLTLPISRNLSFQPAYRFSQSFTGHVPIHILKVGVRYRF